ncbi:MAG: HAD family hydrolase [Gammaproteobacteria bacterium]|nr:MAG: HAD family hydrolase [Gammaproteobacteria bacterium]
MKYELIVFDWDGTLKDSQSHIVDGLCIAAKELGVELRREDAKDIIGLSLVSAIEKLVPGISSADLERFVKIYREHFYKTLPQTNLFDGVEHMLQNLASQGYMLAVATGMSRAGLDSSMQKLGVAKYFDDTICADESVSKPAPDMLVEVIDRLGVDKSCALMIGDTEFDLEMALNAGVDSVAVCCGVHERKRLEKYPVKVILGYTPEIVEWLKQ